MKKIPALLAAALFVVILAACSSAQPQTATEAQTSVEEVTPAAGGWTLYEGEAVTLPDEVQTAFDKATETLTGGYYVPVAYLGSQVVAGENYALLCELLPSTNPVATAAEGDSPVSFEVIIIYNDLDGNAQITNAADFNVADYTDNGGKTQTEVLAGGWSVPEEVTSAPISDEAKAAFHKAAETFEGNSLEPMALLGTQVVAGTNYAFLCRSTVGTADPPVSCIQVVTVYEDLDGNATILNICTLDTADFNQ